MSRPREVAEGSAADARSVLAFDLQEHDRTLAARNELPAGAARDSRLVQVFPRAWRGCAPRWAALRTARR